MSVFCDINRKILKLERLLENAPDGAGIDRYILGGQIIGQTLVLNRNTGGSVNIPLSGVEMAIDFSQLLPCLLYTSPSPRDS